MSSDEVTSRSLVAEWQPVTPFAEVSAAESDGHEPAEAVLESSRSSSTPFVSEYFTDEAEDAVDPRSAELVELLDDLYDPEFDEQLDELADELDDAYRHQFQFAYQDAAVQDTAAESFLSTQLTGLREQAERTLERLAREADERDLTAMTEGELDRFLAEFEMSDTGLPPAFEGFLGKLVKKAGRFVRKAAKAATRLLPIGKILAKAKVLVKPLLDRVLQFALDKLPPALRPAASQLATRLLGTQPRGAAPAAAGASSAAAPEEPASAEPAQPAAADTGQIQQEFDLALASLLLATDEPEADVALAETVSAVERSGADSLAQLHRARERFLHDITELEEGQDATSAVQNFIPAVLPVLRLGIKLIGRPKVVNFLGKYVARMISRFVGPTTSTPLARAMVDVGLRMLNMEVTHEHEARAAERAISGAVEDTVRRVTELDEAVLDNDALLEAAVAEAFDSAAAANFPPELLVPELRESEAEATWLLLPLQGTPRYKRFSRVFDARLTPRIAGHLRSFGGTTLDALLRDRYGITGPVTARVRIYEAVPGSTLARIAAHEHERPGRDEPNGMQVPDLHPLTPEAAGLLLQAPGLGRDVHDTFLADPRLIATGQRFYHLEVPSTPPQQTPAAPGSRRPPRSTRLSVSFRFTRNEISVRLFLSEADAQAITAKVGQGSAPALTRLLLNRIDAGVREALSGKWCRRVRFIHEAVPEDYLLGSALSRLPAPLRGWLTTTLLRWLHATVTGSFLTQHGPAASNAAANPADGITIGITFANPPGMKLLAAALRGRAPTAKDLAALPGGTPQSTVSIRPGRG